MEGMLYVLETVRGQCALYARGAEACFKRFEELNDL